MSFRRYRDGSEEAHVVSHTTIVSSVVSDGHLYATMGLDTDRFFGEVNEGLLCCVCKDVLEDPLQAPCEHAFCRECILGWLVNECTCPEDRRPLFESDLRPLHRYMRNDLGRLRLHCQFAPQGCPEICLMEGRQRHEISCNYAEVTCPYVTCSLMMTRRELEEHILLCHSSTNAATGTTLTDHVQSTDTVTRSEREKEYVLIDELRTTVDVLRADMTCKMEDQRREMEVRLDMQRGHMIQREAVLHSQIDSLKADISRLKDRMQTILDVEMDRRRELDRLALERTELKTMLQQIQHDQKESSASVCPHCAKGITKVTHV